MQFLRVENKNIMTNIGMNGKVVQLCGDYVHHPSINCRLILIEVTVVGLSLSLSAVVLGQHCSHVGVILNIHMLQAVSDK